MTVGELLNRMSAAELDQWKRFYQLEPFGGEVADQRHGLLCAVTMNANGAKKQSGGRFEPSDFIPDRKRKAKSGGQGLGKAVKAAFQSVASTVGPSK